eukprot:gene1793-2105_t
MGASKLWIIVYESLSEILHSLRMVTRSDLGHVFEVLVYNWMMIKLAVSVENKDEVSLTTIFKLESFQALFFGFVEPMENELKFERFERTSLSANFNKDPIGSRLELENIVLTNQSPVALIKPAAGESWAMGLKLLFPDRDTPIYVFVEMKRRAGGQGTKRKKVTLCAARKGTKKGTKRLSEPPTLYNQISEVMTGTDFVYILMGGDVQESQCFERCVILDEEATGRYMGELKGFVGNLVTGAIEGVGVGTTVEGVGVGIPVGVYEGVADEVTHGQNLRKSPSGTASQVPYPPP